MTFKLFRSIEDTCSHLLWALERYQDRIWVMAHEESSIGRFLRDGSRVDTTRAGCMMAGTGKTMSFVAQQRIKLRDPLVRLYKDVETFQYRAVTDTYDTIEKMEKSRTGYRAALLWMKDVSQKLNPDDYKQLEKFRKVQAHVRRCKSRFERIKLDTHQKIDMLCASRVNMLSHSLTMYQNGLLTFFGKADQTLVAVSDLFNGFQYYESNILRDVRDGKRQTIEESLKKEIESKLASIFTEEQDKQTTGQSPAESSVLQKSTAPDLAKNQHSPTIPLLDLGLPQTESASQETGPNVTRPQVQGDFLTDFDSSEKEMLNELFAICETPVAASNNKKEESSYTHCHLPSQLVDDFSHLKTSEPSTEHGPAIAEARATRQEHPADKWLNLFSELDPLSNPDAVGKSAEDDRNC